MNRTKSLALFAIFAVAAAVLIVYALRPKPTASTAGNLAAASSTGNSPTTSSTRNVAAACKDADLAVRRFQIVNLSLGRTGTASIAGLFDRFRSAHEFMLIETLTHILDWQAGSLSTEALDAFLLERDGRFRLEQDSTTVLHLAQDRMIALFPDAKFLLTVRNGDDWLASTLDLMTYIHQTCAEKDIFHDLPCSELILQTGRLARTITPQFKEELYRDIENLGTNIRPLLPDLAAYWGNWTLTTINNLSQLPQDRVLIIRTKNISHSLDRLAAFAGIEKSGLNLKNHHINRDRKSHDFAGMIGRDRIADAFQPWQARVDARMSELDIE